MTFTWKPCFFGELLGTGYQDFRTDNGVGGLARITGKHFELLAVISSRPRTGQFRDFIAKLKTEYETISVWEDWNPILSQALQRYEFRPVTQIEPDGERLHGWRWGKDVAV